MRYFVLIFLIFFLGSPGICSALTRSAKATIFVVSEDGAPIEGAKVTISFEESKGLGINPTPKRGLTNSTGVFSESNQNDSNQISYSAVKEGFYSSSGEYKFANLKLGHWQPWNPELKVVMRKVENPVPMFARNAGYSKLAIPVVGEEVGFDLIAFDWVPPYGKGEYSDFVFYLEKRFASWRDYDIKLIVKFSNINDGIIKMKEDFENGSEFKLPRYAPENGYINEMTIQGSVRPKKGWSGNFDWNDCYIFRIRSKTEEGKLISALYGKILGPIEVDQRTDPTDLNFKYYLNPDGTRNLEFDPKRNLFENLTGLERVKNP